MAKINIDKFICDYYEAKKKTLPYGVMSSEVAAIDRLLRSQNLEIHDGELKEINEGKPKFKVGQCVIYENEYFYIYNIERGYYYLIGTGDTYKVVLPFVQEDELTLVHDNVLTLTDSIVKKSVDGFTGFLNELFMDFPKIPFIDMLRIVQRVEEYLESQPKQTLPNDDKTIKVEQGTDLYIPSEVVSAFMQDERKGWFMLSKHAAIIFGLTEKEMGIIIKIVKSWKKCDTNNESKSGAT